MQRTQLFKRPPAFEVTLRVFGNRSQAGSPSELRKTFRKNFLEFSGSILCALRELPKGSPQREPLRSLRFHVHLRHTSPIKQNHGAVAAMVGEL